MRNILGDRILIKPLCFVLSIFALALGDGLLSRDLVFASSPSSEHHEVSLTKGSSEYVLGLYSKSRGDIQSAVNDFKSSAQQGMPLAAIALGKLYLGGEAGERSLDGAEEMFRLAADAGVLEARLLLTALRREYLQFSDNLLYDHDFIIDEYLAIQRDFCSSEQVPSDQSLIDAVVRDDIDSLLLALIKECVLEQRDDEGWTPLIHASLYGNLGIVLALLEAGADPNAGSYSGATPLITAAFGGHEEIVRALLSAGANVVINSEEHTMSAISFALEGDNANVAWFLDSLVFTTKEDIARIQVGLHILGYDAGPPDGVLGPRTKRAIGRYQEDRDLEVTSDASNVLLEHLLASVARILPDEISSKDVRVRSNARTRDAKPREGLMNDATPTTAPRFFFR